MKAELVDSKAHEGLCRLGGVASPPPRGVKLVSDVRVARDCRWTELDEVANKGPTSQADAADESSAVLQGHRELEMTPRLL